MGEEAHELAAYDSGCAMQRPRRKRHEREGWGRAVHGIKEESAWRHRWGCKSMRQACALEKAHAAEVLVLGDAAHDLTAERYEARQNERGDMLRAAHGNGGQWKDGGHARTGGGG